MFIRQASVFARNIQKEITLNGLTRGYKFKKTIVECPVKYNIRLNSSDSTIMNQPQKSSVVKEEENSSICINSTQTHTNSSIAKSTKSTKSSNKISLLKPSLDIKLSIEQLKERTQLTEMDKNGIKWKEWTEEETNLLFMALELHGNRWKFIHRNYFNYRTLHSIKCKWDRVKLKYENSRKTILSEWTPEEDEILLKAVEKYGKGKWRKISRILPNKNALQVYRRYYFIKHTKRGNFTEEEDNLLCNLLIKYGGNYWQRIAEEMNRPVHTIMKHYKFVLLNDAKFSTWTDQENELISNSILKYGKDWKKIQNLLPHRLRRSIKEHVRFCSFADPHYNSGFWAIDETMRLVKAVRLYGKSWQDVSKVVKTRSPFQCRIYFRDVFTRKGREPYILNLELEGIKQIFPTEDQAILEKLAAEQILMELRSPESESEYFAPETTSTEHNSRNLNETS
ncbi:15705_t:CDS:2 [Funneliformis mosseae]|uniref:15705_t:CDS:1 n=1 Tax=Funneliformis mosseae TaxID=27381 RepID=A0A9N9GIK2_FUNMO|nr:15705_t:CDS:2 [Funneliformis mosseae]